MPTPIRLHRAALLLVGGLAPALAGCGAAPAADVPAAAAPVPPTSASTPGGGEIWHAPNPGTRVRLATISAARGSGGRF